MRINWGLAILAGLLQGIVEWLPVSSKTMITLLLAASGLTLTQAYALGLVANFGSFFAALFYFRKDVFLMLRGLAHPFARSEDAVLLRYAFLATLMTGVVGLPLYVTIRAALSITGGSIGMLIVGILLLFTAWVSRKKEGILARQQAEGTRYPKAPTTGVALVTGACQGLAALPGISRSGITVTPLLGLGFNGEEAIRLSFLLDVPALLAAGVVPFVLGHGGMRAVQALGVGTTVVMILVAAVVSFFTIGVILDVARRMRTSVITLAIAVITLAVAVAGITLH